MPHFEKMLYDQGQLAVSYLNAYQITKDEFYADIAKDILQYVARDLRDSVSIIILKLLTIFKVLHELI